MNMKENGNMHVANKQVGVREKMSKRKLKC